MRARLTDATSSRRLLSTVCVSCVLTILVATPAIAVEVLFPEPLHITREITDPISGATVTVDEYCHGNRIAAVEGPRTAIVDYERGEITSIDRSRGTFSITSFEAVASAHQGAGESSKASKPWRVEPVAPGALTGGRSTDRFVATREGGGEITRIELALDRQVHLSKRGIEAILGSSYPNPSSPALEVIEATLEASPVQIQSKATGETVRYPLPVEQRTTYGSGGESLVFSNRVVRVGSELAPSDLVAIPAGFRRVDDVQSARARMLRELDSLSIPGSVQP